MILTDELPEYGMGVRGCCQPVYHAPSGAKAGTRKTPSQRRMEVVCRIYVDIHGDSKCLGKSLKLPPGCFWNLNTSCKSLRACLCFRVSGQGD